MGTRRMFSQRIVESGRFLRMPITIQALYFHLGMYADDEGIVEAFPVLKMIDCTEDHLKFLEEKGFIKILNDDLIVYLNDWNENNIIRSDRKKESIYHDLIDSKEPEDEEKSSKNQVDDKWQPNDNQVTTKCQPNDRIREVKRSKEKLSKDKLINNNLLLEEVKKEVKEKKEEELTSASDKTNIMPFVDYQRVVDSFEKYWPGKRIRDITDARKEYIRALVQVYGYDAIEEGFRKASEDPFLSGKVSDNGRPFIMQFNWIIQREHFAEVLESRWDRSIKAKNTIQDSGTDYGALESQLVENY